MSQSLLNILGLSYRLVGWCWQQYGIVYIYMFPRATYTHLLLEAVSSWQDMTLSSFGPAHLQDIYSASSGYGRHNLIPLNVCHGRRCFDSKCRQPQDSDVIDVSTSFRHRIYGYSVCSESGGRKSETVRLSKAPQATAVFMQVLELIAPLRLTCSNPTDAQ